MRNLYSLTKQTPLSNLAEIWANKQQEYMVTQSNNEGMAKYYLIFVLFLTKQVLILNMFIFGVCFVNEFNSRMFCPAICVLTVTGLRIGSFVFSSVAVYDSSGNENLIFAYFRL